MSDMVTTKYHVIGIDNKTRMRSSYFFYTEDRNTIATKAKELGITVLSIELAQENAADKKK